MNVTRIPTLPVEFTITKQYESKDCRFLDVTIDVPHTGLNCNSSIFQKEIVDQCAESIKNTPILGRIKIDGAGNTENFEHYIHPQENGAHYGTRFAEIVGEKAGLSFEPYGMEHFSFNVQHFTAEMLEDIMHDFELKPLNDTVVSLDWHMTGISKAIYHNDSECDLCRIDEKKIQFGFRIKPFCKS